MATVNELRARRDKLLQRFESLQKRVTHGDKTVEYDLSQAKTAMELLDREIATATKASGGKVLRSLYIRSDKDL